MKSLKLVIIVGFLAVLPTVVLAGQNPIFPIPYQCQGADWRIGLPDGVACHGSVFTGGSGIAMENDYKARNVFGGPSRLKPELVSLNAFCKDYTDDPTSVAVYGRMHTYCTGCDNNLSAWTGTGWVTRDVCAGTTNVQQVECAVGCALPPPPPPRFCANGISLTAAEFDHAMDVGAITITWDSQIDHATFHVDNDTGCTAPLTASSYRVFIQPKNPGWLATQEFLAESPVVTMAPSGVTNVPVPVTSCKTQVDLWYGPAPHGFTSDNEFEFGGHFLLKGGIVPGTGLCTIACRANADCGTSAYTGSPFCQGGNVYQNYITYTCNNPGTPASVCSNNTAAQLKATCAAGQTCANGTCVEQTIACRANADCGTSAYTGSPYCGQNGDVYQNYITYTCNNAGTPASYCSNNTASQKKTDCTTNQVCGNGSCTNQNIACTANADCGTSAYTGSPYCSGNDVWQNYITYTCNNAGLPNSYCSNNTVSQKKTDCTGSQICGNGSCGNQNITCTSNSDCGVNAYTGSPYCQGNNVYQNYITYTCNNPGASNSYCSNNTASQLKNSCYGGQTCNNGSCGQVYNNISVETDQATNVGNGYATLNGYLDLNNSGDYNCPTYIWFQYGPNWNYGSETQHLQKNYSGSFQQNVSLYNNYGNYNNGMYHFRAVAQSSCGNQGLVYGQDMTIGSQNNNGNISVTKTVKNLTTGSGFSNVAYAKPGDMLMFMITLQSNNGDAQNVFVRDTLPANLIYNNQLVVAGNYNNNSYNNYSGNIASGVNLNTLYSGQMVTITYQVQVAGPNNFAYGSTTLTNNVSVTSSNSGYNPASNASVIVTRTGVYGASSISTGLTNNFWADSFALPMLLTLIGLWLWRSGAFFGIERWFDNRKKNKNAYNAEKELAARIASIRNAEII